MTELSGTLEGVGLPAIVRFLSGLKKTGCLRIVHNDLRGEIFFDLGRVTGVSLGSRHGLSALDALVQALPGGSFTFDVASGPAGETSISLSAEALQAHLDDLAVQSANGTSRLPSFDAVPAALAQDSSSSGDEPLPLDRGTLQTWLAVDGQRTVREIVAQRGSIEALWQLANLAEEGFLRLSSYEPVVPGDVVPALLSSNDTVVPGDVVPALLSSNDTVAPGEVATPAPSPNGVAGPGEVLPAAAATPQVATPSFEPIAVEPERVAPAIARPFAMEMVPEDASGHCPKLGFEDDPSSSFSRPTRTHRCFAAGTPLPLSLDQQRELCLGEQFGTCPRLTMGGFVPPARDAQAAFGIPALRRPGIRRPGPEADDPRIVRLPFVGRAKAAERGAVADRQAVGGSEPTRLRSAGSPVRAGAAPPSPTPLRSRVERANALGSDCAVAEPPTVLTHEPRATKSNSVGQALVDAPGKRRVGGIRVGVIASGSVVLLVLAVIVYLLGTHVGDWFVDDSLDPSVLPNASAVAAGTPIAQVTAVRATRATGVISGTDTAADTSDAATAKAAPSAGSATSAASTTSAATVAPAPILPLESIQAVPQPAPAQPAAAPASVAQPAAAPPGAAPAANTVLDERFTNNDRKWPSTTQSTAFLSNGRYTLAPRQAGQFVAVGAPVADTLKDVVVNATFHKLSGPLGGGYGIIVRDQASAPQNGIGQDGHYYVLEVGDKGEVGMWRRDGDHWVDLWPWQPNPAVKPGIATNELSVRVVGNRLSLSVNGTLVAAKTDDTFSTGGVGLFAGGDGNQVAVDRFSIQTP